MLAGRKTPLYGCRVIEDVRPVVVNRGVKELMAILQNSLKHAARAVALTLGFLLLAGCAGGMFGRGDKKPAKITAKNCPSIAVLSQASSITVFAPGAKHSIENIRYDARIAKVAVDCKVSGNQVTAEFGLSGRISLGPKGVPGKKSLPVFAALTLKDQKVRDKVVRNSTVTLRPGRRNANFIEVIDDYTFTLDAGKKPTDYEILAGFELSPAQLRYNQRNR